MDQAGGSCSCNALQLATHKLDLPIMQVLLEAGANPSAPDVDQRIAIQYLPSRSPENTVAWEQAYELLKNRM